MERWQVELAAAFLSEDVGRGDRTTEAVLGAGRHGVARIEARQDLIIAGMDIVEACFATVDPSAVFAAQTFDGKRATSGDVLIRLDGDLSSILTAERTALNLLGRLCGVATLTSAYVQRISGTGAFIVDTRKTTPGLRRLEKDAVRAGGGRNHRWGLDDGILIKDNHIAAAGGVAAAVHAARDTAQHGLAIEVEVADLDELEEAIDAGATIVLLDNMPAPRVAEAVERIPEGVLVEASGGITLDTVLDYARAGAHLISVGALTHSAPACDVSLEVEEA